MAIEVTQIGTIPIRISRDVPAYEHDARATNEGEAAITDGGAFFPSNRYGLRLTERDIDGDIVVNREQDVEGYYSTLKSYVNHPVPIYGLYPLRILNGGIDAIWLQTFGTVSRFRLEPNKDNTQRLRVEITSLGAWKPLNRLVNRYTDEIQSNLTLPDTPSSVSETLLSSYPSMRDFLDEYNAPGWWYWIPQPERYSLMDEPDYWGLLVDYLPQGFPSIGEHREWTTESLRLVVWQDEQVWNHRPQCVYAFKGLESTYNPTLTIYRNTGNGGTETITIDSDALDTILTDKTATGLQTDDVLMIGDVQGKAYVVRDGERIYCSSILGAYGGVSPGYIPNGEHIEYEVDFSRDSQIEWASIFLWRMMV